MYKKKETNFTRKHGLFFFKKRHKVESIMEEPRRETLKESVPPLKPKTRGCHETYVLNWCGDEPTNDRVISKDNLRGLELFTLT